MIAEATERRRLLLFHHFFYPDDVVSSRLFSDLAVGLVANGWEVTTLTSNRIWSDPKKSLPARERHARVQIERVFRPPWRQAVPLERLANSAWMSVAWLAKAMRMCAPDAVVVGSDPSFAAALMLPMHRRWPKAAIAHWCHDLYPEALVALGMGSFVNALVPLARHLMSASYRACDVLVDVGPGMRAKLARYRSPAQRTTIPPWSLIEPSGAPSPPDPALRRQWFGTAQLGLLYSGALGRAHDLKPLLELARLCRRRFAGSVAFCFSCRGYRVGELGSHLRSDDTNVHLANFGGEQDLQTRLEAADLHLISLLPSLSGLSVPSKFLGALAAGRPVVYAGAEDSDVGQWLARYDVGCTFQAGRVEAVADFLANLAAHPAALRTMQHRARSVYATHFRRDLAIAAWDRVLRAAIASRRHA
jgi:glycosyltransferase involved in cell wall biosynthesis